MSPVFQIPTEQKLLPIAQLLAKSLNHQKIVFLEGGLGAGKTTFIRYLLEAISTQYKSPFEFQGSPTYQREHIYNFAKLNIVHFDFYQVDAPLRMDLEDYIVDYCILVEWPFEELKKRYAREAMFIKIAQDNKKRVIEMQSQNTQWLRQINLI